MCQHFNESFQERESLHAGCPIFAFGVEQRDFDDEDIGSPRDWATDDVKGDMPPDDCPGLFGRIHRQRCWSCLRKDQDHRPR